jgi:hypothetical protein
VSAITQSAAGQTCTIRVPGICEFHHCVLTHYRLAGTCGAGMEAARQQGAYGCTPCRRSRWPHAPQRPDRCTLRRHAEGVMRSQLIMLRLGLIHLAPDARPPKLSFQGVELEFDAPRSCRALGRRAGGSAHESGRAKWLQRARLPRPTLPRRERGRKAEPNATPRSTSARRATRPSARCSITSSRC